MTTILLLFACAHHPAPAPAVDVPAILRAAASAVRAVPTAEPAACVVVEAVSSALVTAAEVVGTPTTLPAVRVDVSRCGLTQAVVEVPAAGDAALAAVAFVPALAAGADCPTAAWLNAATTYARGAGTAAVAELRAPDGVVEVPVVPVEVCAGP